MEWFTESLRTLNLDNLIMKTTDAPTEGEQPMPPLQTARKNRPER